MTTEEYTLEECGIKCGCYDEALAQMQNNRPTRKRKVRVTYL